MAEKILLGAHSYTVRPQKIGYLIHKLGPNLQEALQAQVEGIEGAALIGAKAYDVLKVFIPDLMPLHEFLGFASEEAMAAGAYDEDEDNSPLEPQIEAAFKAASDVNGGKVVSGLKGLLGPVLTQKLTAFLVARMSEETGPLSTISAPSPTSPSASGDSASTNSGTTAPTTTPPESAG